MNKRKSSAGARSNAGTNHRKVCECSTLERIAADNDPRNGLTGARIVAMTEGRCNGCGGIRPDELEYWKWVARLTR
jgi:hypothetical protein